MKYNNIREALFLERPNRFIAYALLDGEKVKCHVKNTGRCRELLTENAVVFILQMAKTLKRLKAKKLLLQLVDVVQTGLKSFALSTGLNIRLVQLTLVFVLKYVTRLWKRLTRLFMNLN